MANSFTTQPLVLDTDFTSFRTAASATDGIKAMKLMLVVGHSGAAVAGIVSIAFNSTRGSTVLYPNILVGTQAADTTILNDNLPTQVLTWTDFGVTGLTATGTKLYIWEKL